jgi:hypothetical protein
MRQNKPWAARIQLLRGSDEAIGFRAGPLGGTGHRIEHLYQTPQELLFVSCDRGVGALSTEESTKLSRES